jgi:SAM-dependent methyltransferase
MMTERQAAEQSGYDPIFFEQLFQVEDRHFWFRTRNRVLAALARAILQQGGGRVLEVGCGTGNVLRVLASACPGGLVVGMDLFAEGLALARRRTGCPLVQGDMQAAPFSAQFDLVGLFDVLEHLPDDRAVLRDLRGLLAPGGHLLLTVPAHPWLWSYFDEAAHHCRRYTEADLEQKLREAGYTVEYCTPYMAAILPLVWLRRKLAGRVRPASVSEQALTSEELRIVPGLNAALIALLSFEAAVLARGRRLPFGTSLLVLARRAAAAPGGSA